MIMLLIPNTKVVFNLLNMFHFHNFKTKDDRVLCLSSTIIKHPKRGGYIWDTELIPYLINIILSVI